MSVAKDDLTDDDVTILEVYMPVMQPASPRSTIEDKESALIITIPTHKDWLSITVMLFWLASWACGELTVVGMGAIFLFGGLVGWLGNSPETSAAGLSAFVGMSLFWSFWFVIWTIGGLFALYYLLWQFTGAERIEIGAQTITLRRLVLNMGSRPRTYLAEHIRDLRTVANPPYSWWWSSRMYYWQWMFGSINFDYGAKTIRCGSGVDEAEAKHIIKTIQERFPRYQTKQNGTTA